MACWPAGLPGAYRITSYNVCYTKLLRSCGQTSFLDVAEEGFEFRDGRVGTADRGGQGVGRATCGHAVEAEVPGHSDLFNQLALYPQRLDPFGDQCPCLDLAPFRADA